MNQQQLKYEKRSAKRRKMINELKNEISNLEKEVKNIQIQNKKNKRIRNLKLIVRISNFTIPYVLTTGICIGTFSYFGATPFLLDDVKQYSNVKKTFDNLGNIKYEQQYQEYSEKANVINYYGKWEKIENGFYKREIETYGIGKITEDKISEILNNPHQTLTEIFGKPIVKRVETSNNISSAEVNQKSFLQAIVYSEIKSDYIMVKEKVSDNVWATIGLLIITLFFQLVPALLIDKYIPKRSKWEEEIEEKYPIIDINTKQKKLEIKKSNYNILSR